MGPAPGATWFCLAGHTGAARSAAPRRGGLAAASWKAAGSSDRAATRAAATTWGRWLDAATAASWAALGPVASPAGGDNGAAGLLSVRDGAALKGALAAVKGDARARVWA